MRHSLLPFALIAVALSCTRATTKVAPRESRPAGYQRQIVDRSPSGMELATVPVEQIPAVVDVVYRVRPDRRFVNAAADIVEIATGRRVDAVEIDFANGAWNVRVDGKPAVTFPELATVHDAVMKLSAWAVQQPQAGRATFTDAELQSIDADLDRFYPRFIFAALKRLDRGKPLDAAGARRAARAAAILCAQTEDRFDLADPLRGRAIALLAIAKSLDATCCGDVEAIMALSLGYDLEAEQIAKNLPKSFARDFAAHEDPGSHGDAAEEWLAVFRRLGRESILGSNGKPFSGTIDIEAVPAICENENVDNSAPYGGVVQSAILASLRGKGPATLTVDESASWKMQFRETTPVKAQQEFESDLPAAANARKSRFVDARAVLSFYEANWYAATHQQFSMLDDHLGDVPGTKEFALSLHPSTATGRTVSEWMLNLVDAEYEAFDANRVAPSLTSASLLGGQERYRLFEAITRSIGTATREVQRGARDLFRTLDSRPSEMLVAGKLANYPIGYIARRDVYLKAATDRVPRRFEQERAEFLFATGDREGLQRLASDRSIPIADRIDALCRMREFSDVDLHADFEQVFAENKYATEWLSCYWTYLNSRKEWRVKERFARKVLANRPDLDAISRAWVSSSLAHALEAQGRYSEAWQLVEPQIGVGSANILLIATSLLQRIGQSDKAIELGRRTIDRYPDADALSDFAAVLWRLGRYDEAADLFNPGHHAYAMAVARENLPLQFLSTFSDADVPQALAAYDALIKAGAPPFLLDSIVGRAYREKRWAFGLTLNDRYLTLPALSTDIGMKIRAYTGSYEAMRAVKGDAAAFQWFVEAFPTATQEILANLLSERRFELLNAYAAARPPRTSPLECSSLIAASLAFAHVPLSDPRWDFVRHLLPRSVGARDRTIQASVRYLLREIDASAVARTVVDANNRSEAMYFLAVRAASDNDFDQALLYYLGAAEGPFDYPTTSWANAQLYAWYEKNRSWQDIARERLL